MLNWIITLIGIMGVIMQCILFVKKKSIKTNFIEAFGLFLIIIGFILETNIFGQGKVISISSIILIVFGILLILINAFIEKKY